jgi:hypothetical protein
VYTSLVATPSASRFPIRFEAWYRVLSSALFLRPSDSFVDVGDDAVSVRTGWAFSARFARSTVAGTSRLDRAPLSRRVHGFGDRWLVNGSGDRILVVDFEPTQRARVLGFPVHLRQLRVSVDDPAALAERLRPT